MDEIGLSAFSLVTIARAEFCQTTEDFKPTITLILGAVIAMNGFSTKLYSPMFNNAFIFNSLD